MTQKRWKARNTDKKYKFPHGVAATFSIASAQTSLQVRQTRILQTFCMKECANSKYMQNQRIFSIESTCLFYYAIRLSCKLFIKHEKWTFRFLQHVSLLVTSVASLQDCFRFVITFGKAIRDQNENFHLFYASKLAEICSINTSENYT